MTEPTPAPAPSRPPTLFEVFPGTAMSECRSCRHTPLYWITTKKGKKMLVDCHAGTGCVAPSEERPGRGVSHFIACPQRNKWRKTK